MSYDSISRINDHYVNSVVIPNNLYTIDDDKNEGIKDDPGGGIWTKTFFEASDDIMTGQSLPKLCYQERGLFTVHVFAQKGLGTLDTYGLSRIATLVRNSFRNKKLQPTGNEEGVILFESVGTRQTIEVESEYSIPYMRKDIFIVYQKNYQL